MTEALDAAEATDTLTTDALDAAAMETTDAFEATAAVKALETARPDESAIAVELIDIVGSLLCPVAFRMLWDEAFVELLE